ncbi:MAG: hypothetical protein AB7U97_23310 [Pirellulales bacterium]
MSIAAKPYLLEIDGLAEAVAAWRPDPKHRTLIAALQRFEPLAHLKLATTRGDTWLSQCKVLRADGSIVADDHEQWLGEQLQADGGDAWATYERLKDAGYLLSKCELVTLYLIADRGTDNQADFIQVEVCLEDERMDRALLTPWPWSPPKDLNDLLSQPGPELGPDARSAVRPIAYRLRRVIDVERFVILLEALEAARRTKLRQRRYVSTSVDTGETRELTHDELSPGWDRYPVKARRLFGDWAASSAGRSGARLCEHWAMQISDYTSSTGHRDAGLIPLWTFSKPLAEVNARKGSDYEFYGQLQKLDRRVKVPFGWYFYMLHGNRVSDGAGRRVIASAEAGQIVLPEHDYQVLKAWQAQPYGF